MTNKNQIASYKSGLVKTQETFVDMLVESGQNMALQYDQYQLSCARNMMSKMVELLWKDGLTINDVNNNNVTDILQTVAMLRLNPSASPREVYVILRNVKAGETWQKVFEMGVEGDGNDKLLREYGVGVIKVHNYWAVREGDEFTYPAFSGLEIKPPSWSPKGYTNKVLRVVYPIELENSSVEYHIAERESVVVNLQAHISNNLMKNKAIKDDAKKAILDRIATLTLDELCSDDEAMGIASPAWRSAHSREAMILRKMRNNAIKKIPKDFKNSFVEQQYETTFEDYEQHNSHPDVDPEKVVETEFVETAVKEEISIPIIAAPEEPSEEVTEEQIQEDAKESETTAKPEVKRPF